MKRTIEQVYEAEIKSLREEISTIQNQQENNDREVALHFGDRIQRPVASQSDFTRGQKDSTVTLKMELENLEEDLARQAKINGIVLAECEVKTVEKSKNKIVQQHRLSGHCYYLAFQVEFELKEFQDDSTVLRSVTCLNIVVDGSECSAISAFVSAVEEKSSLLLFFRTLKGFAERCEHRNRTFQHFKQKYPEVVSLPGGFRGEVMVIQDPKVPGCTLSIVWKINVSKDGVITPKMDLLAKLPEQALDLGQQVAENAPQAFQSLVRILGVEAAIENLITAVCME